MTATGIASGSDPESACSWNHSPIRGPELSALPEPPELPELPEPACSFEAPARCTSWTRVSWDGRAPMIEAAIRPLESSTRNAGTV